MRSTVSEKVTWTKLSCFLLLCYFCCVAWAPSLIMAIIRDEGGLWWSIRPRPHPELKNWHEYTEEEKEMLRKRWTRKEIQEEVVDALKAGRPRPDWVPQLDSLLYRPEDDVGDDFRGIDLESQDLRGVHLAGLCFQGANFENAELQKAILRGANLQGADLTEANLEGADLTEANLQNATLTRANLQVAILIDANLQDVRAHEADLREADLTEANLQDAIFTKANLQTAILLNADLQRVTVLEADLIQADLRLAKLQDAVLREADLAHVNLYMAKLQRADLRFAHLQSANLYRAYFDSTYLFQVNLGAAKNIRYIIWGDSVKNRYVIGEEKVADSTNSDEDFRKARNTYRDLKSFYEKELIDEVSREFHFRENVVKTKLSPWYLKAFRVPFLEWTYGYGSRSIRLLWYSLIVIGLFTLLFAFLTIPRKTKSGIYLLQPVRRSEREALLAFRKGVLFLHCFYFSVLSFATFGYGALKPKQWLQLFRLEPVEYKPVRWARIFVGIEAALGIYIFALLVTVLFGRG